MMFGAERFFIIYATQHFVIEEVNSGMLIALCMLEVRL